MTKASRPARRYIVRGVAVLAVLSACRGEAREPASAGPPVNERSKEGRSGDGVAGAAEGKSARGTDQLPWPAIDEAALIGLVATENATLGAPVPLAIAPDGAVVFQRARPREPTADLYQLDAAGRLTVLFAAAQLSGPSAAARAPGFTAINMSDDGTRILVPVAERVFVVERATAAARELPIGPHRDPALSPDGRQLAFVRDGDLWVAPIPASGPLRPTRVTQHPADREYATPEATAADLGRRRGYWWSPDSQWLAFQRTDATAVETRYVLDPAHPERAPEARKLPRSGQAIAQVDLGIVSARGGAPRWVTWERTRYPYLARVVWPARGPLTLVVVNREQTQLAALAADPATGATRPLVVDKDPAWIELAPEPLVWLPDGSGFLWMTERRGAWGLERRAADGTELGQAVTPDLGLRRVVGISGDGRDVIVEATSDPRELHVWRVPLAGGPAVALTSGGGVHRAYAGHGIVVITSLAHTGGRLTTVVRPGGSRSELPSVAEPRKLATTTQLETVALDDHVQYAAVTRPRSFAPGVRYPVLLRIDGDPTASAVLDANDTYLTDQWYADAGFIVVRTDGRGTPGRDRMWQRVIAGDVLTIPMNDQIGALKQLGARYPELDLGRVGAIGARFGGYLAALAGLLHPDVFAAAVAVAPITDWALASAAYAERYLRTPAQNPEGYRRTAASSYAEQLARPLLLVPDTTDSLGLAHTLTLVEALSAASQRVELAALPPAHDLARETAGHKLALAFLRQHLGPPVRPQVMPAPRSEAEEEKEEEERERKREQR